MVDVDDNAWTTLALVREHLEFASSDTSKDEQLKSLINRSYKILEKYIGRVVKSTQYTEYQDGDGTPQILLNQWPIISVTSIHSDVERDFGSDTEIEAANYLIYSDEGRIELYKDETIFPEGKQNVKVIYTAGYAEIPDDLEFASTLHIAGFFKKAGNEGLLTKSLGGLSLSFQRVPIAEDVKIIVDAYRKRYH